MIVTARLSFSAAHRLHNPNRDAEWNRRTFNEDNNPGGHGHNYFLQVSVHGTIEGDTGMVIDLKKLKDIIRERVIDHVDHSTVLNPILWSKGIRTLMGVPLIAGGKVIGVFHIGSLTPREFTDDDLEFLQLAADRAATAVHSLMMQEDRIAAAAQDPAI